MATFRVGVGSFNIQDGAVGFGTDTDGLGNLKVKGVTKTTDIKVSGASTLTRYSGFAADNIDQLENITLTSEVGTIGDIVVGVGTSVIISSGSTVTVGTVESVSIGTHFSPPKGGIEERGDNFIEGMMRFNTDLNTMEFYNGNEWRQFTYISDIKNSPSGRGRGVFGGGQSPGTEEVIDFVNIASQGNAVNFGQLTSAKHSVGAVSSEIRGLYAGQGPGGGVTTDIEYLTIAAGGNAIDFGDLTAARRNTMGMSSSTRGIFCGGVPAPTTVDYIQIATLGNAISFGTAIFGVSYGLGNMSNGVRGLAGGGQVNGTPRETGLINFTISSLGNGTNFGDMTVGRSSSCGCSNNTRGLILGGTINGSDKPDVQSSMEFITIASEGSGTIFGDLTDARSSINACASQTRGVAAGGGNDPITNIIDFVNISTLGNARDFGDLTVGRVHAVALSDSHGGLGGY